MSEFSYTGLNASTLVAEPNISYLSHTDHTAMADPMGGPAMGLMMLLSTFQYSSPYVNPMYSEASNQAGKAAYTQAGGKELEDRISDKSRAVAYSLGFNDTEIGIIGGTAKAVRDRQLTVKGPKILDIRTSLTAAPGSGSIGLRWLFP